MSDVNEMLLFSIGLIFLGFMPKMLKIGGERFVAFIVGILGILIWLKPMFIIEGFGNDEYGAGFIMFISIIMMVFGSQGRDGGSQMLFLSGIILLIFSGIFKMLGF